MNTPPGTLRSRSFTRFTMRVALPHFGQLVLLLVSMTFLRSAVFAIFAIFLSPDRNVPPNSSPRTRFFAVSEFRTESRRDSERLMPARRNAPVFTLRVSFLILHEAHFSCSS